MILIASPNNSFSIFKIIFSIIGVQLKSNLFKFSKPSFSVLLIRSEMIFSPAPNLILNLVDLPDCTYQLILVTLDVPFRQPSR